MVHDKLFLLLLLIIPLLIWWHSYLKRKGKRHILYSSREIFPVQGRKTRLKLSLLTLFPVLKLLSLAILILALARPVKVHTIEIEKHQGIDILIALDISGSMASIDFTPKNRLEVAKEVIGRFIEVRRNDRIGLVIFAGTSYTKCPLTIDQDILKYFLNDTQLGELEDGTAIGMALATSVNRIRHSHTKSKTIILLTDGVNNRGEIDPRDAAKIAKDFNIKVYTIGVGTQGQALLPVQDNFGGTRHITVNVEIDEELLQQIANRTGGLYFRATDKSSLEKIFGEIDRWEKSEISTRKFFRREERFPVLLLVALVILMLMEILYRSFLRTLP